MSVQRLEEVCSIVMGQAPDGDSYNEIGEGLPLIAGAGDFGDLHPEPSKYTTKPTKICDAGDVVLGIRATIGVKVLANQPACLGRGVAGLRAKEGLHPGFLWHWLDSAAPALAARAKGATFKQVNREDIGSLPIDLPAFPDQVRVVAVMDLADALRAKRRAALALFEALRSALFVEVFGDPARNPKRWPIKTIGDLLESATYGSSEKAGTEGEIPILRMNNITSNGEMDLADLKYVDIPAGKRERFLVRAGDVLFNRTNSRELVGKSAVFHGPEPMAYAGYLIRLRCKSDVAPEYLGAFLNTPYAKRVLRSMCKSIIGMANINAQEIQAMAIPVPDLALQREFAAKVVAMAQAREKQREAVTELDALFASLQHRAFNGTLFSA